MTTSSQDREAMAQALPKIDNCHKNMSATQNKLYGQIEQLMTRWKGNAATAFLGQYKLFNEEFEKVNRGLEDIHSRLLQALQSYTTSESDQQQAANQIAQALG